MTDNPFEIRLVEYNCPNLPSFLSWVRGIEVTAHCHIVFFDENRMAGREHARAAVRFAIRSWEGGVAVARSFDMEALLFAAASRQCGVALEFGIHEGMNRSYLAVWPKNPLVWGFLEEQVQCLQDLENQVSPERSAFLTAHFGITGEELAVTGEERINELVLERVALLWVNR